MTFEAFLAIGGFLIGIIGIIMSYIFYRNSKRAKEPYFFINTNNLFRNNIAQINGLDITFKGKRVENLSISQIAIWNKGKDVIESIDVVKSEPLRIECTKNVQILDSSIIKVNNLTNGFTLTPFDQQRIELTFEYIEKNDGAVIQVIHTGINSEELMVKGKIKGTEIKTYSEKFNRILAYIFLATLILFIGSYFLPKDNFWENIKVTLGYLWGINFLITSIIINIRDFFGKRKGVPKNLYDSLTRK